MRRQQVYVGILLILISLVMPLTLYQPFSLNIMAEGSLLEIVEDNSIVGSSAIAVQPTKDHSVSSFIDTPPNIQAIIDQITSTSYGSVVTHLSSTIGSRVYGSDGNDETVEYISGFFENAGLSVSLHEFDSGGVNVVGVLPGTSSTTEQVLIVGAHFDTTPVSSPGADDNASGVAAVMEIARVLAQYQFQFTIIFVAFNAEEIGLVGSSAYATKLVEDGIDVMVMYNFDMIMWNNPLAPATHKLDIIHNEGASRLYADHASTIGNDWVDAPISTLSGPGLTMSDHSPFWNKGFPAVWFFEHGGLSNPYIHSAQDSLDRPDYSFNIGAVATQTAAAALADLAVITTSVLGFPHASFVSPAPNSFLNPDTEVPIILTIEDSYEDVTQIDLSINYGPWINITSGYNGTHCSYFWTTPPIVGSVSLQAQIFDAAGWIGRAHTVVTIDRGLLCEIIVPTVGEEIIQGTEYTIWVNATDLDREPISYVQVRINKSDWIITKIAQPGLHYHNWTVLESGEVTIEARARDSSGRHNTTTVSIMILSFLPVISDVSVTPLNPSAADSVIISTQVTQDARGSGIQQVLVFYSINNQPFRTRRMSQSNDNTYTTSIGPFAAGTQIRFYIKVWDNLGNTIIDDNSGYYYQFLTGFSPLTLIVASGGTIIIIGLIIGSYLLLRRRSIIKR